MALNIFITLIAATCILFLPGVFLSFVFFKVGKIDIIERMILSFGLSISLVPLMTFYSNLLGLQITTATVMIETTGIFLLTGIFFLIQHVRRKK